MDDTIRVIRAGDVIPDVVARVEKPGARRGRRFTMPPTCPECGTPVVQEGPFDRCPNGLGCPAQLKGAIQHFGSRDALDIRGLGRETVDALVGAGLVKSVADLFTLTERDLMTLEGFAEISARNLVRAIDRARKNELWRFVFGLGVPNVGAQTARDLAAHFETLERLTGASEPDLMAVVLEKSTAFLTSYARAFKAAGADGLIMAEPAAGLLSPRAVSIPGKSR